MSDMTMTIRVDKRRMEQLMRPGAIENLAAPITKKYALVIEGDAKVNAPVLTGNLRNSIQAQSDGPKNWTISDGTEYGVFQELGTRFMPGKFFLTKACEKNADKYFDELRDALK